MKKFQNTKPFNLEQRTLIFAREIIAFSKQILNNDTNRILRNQLVRSGTSVGANYREANETETKKDFSFRMRICRKEAKETAYWLDLLIESTPALKNHAIELKGEAIELVKIFAAIIEKSK